MTGSFAVDRYLSMLMLGFTNFFMGWILPYSFGFVKLCVLCCVIFLELCSGCLRVNKLRVCECFIMG